MWSITEEYHDYLILPIPDVSIFSTPSSFVILASDGIWDILSPQAPADNISMIVGFFSITDTNTSVDRGDDKRPHFHTDDIPNSN